MKKSKTVIRIKSLNTRLRGTTFLFLRIFKKKKNIIDTITNRSKGLARGIALIFIKLIENNEIYMIVPEAIVEI